MSRPEEQDEGEEIKRKMAIEGPKIKKEPDRPGKLMVSGIPKNATYTKEELEREFAVFGPVLEVNIIRKKSTGIAKGFAFVTFKNPPDAEAAKKALEGKDIGGENPLHCEQAVIGFIKQSQIASSRKRMDMAHTRGGPRGGRGGGRGQPLLEYRGGCRGMRGGPPRGGRGRGGGYGGGGDMEGMYYNEEEDYYGGEYWEGEGYGGEYSERGRGGSRGGPPQRGPMRGGPMGMRGRGGPPGRRGGYLGRGGAGGMPASSTRGGYPMRGAGSEQGRPVRTPLLPSPPDMRGGRGGGRGRGYPPSHAGEDYYAEEEGGGYGEEYGAGEEYYEEDPYNNGAGYSEEDHYGAVDEGYYGVPEAPPRPVPAARGRGGAPPPGAPMGRNGPAGPQLYRGAEPPSRGGRPSSARGGGAYGPGSGSEMPSRGVAAAGRNAGPGRSMPVESARRQPSQDPYGYSVDEATGPPRQRPQTEASAYEDYYGEEDMGSMRAAKDPYARPRPAAGRGQAPGPARGAPARRTADPYADDQYGMYDGGDSSQVRGMYGDEGYGEDYDDGYGGAGPGRRGAPPQPKPKPSPASGRSAESRGYVDISEYIGQGSRAASRYREEYQGQGSAREMEREGRRSAPSRREDPYMEKRVAPETDAYVSYPTSSRDTMVRKRPLDGYGHDPSYEEYRGMPAPTKRERVDRSMYDAYSSRQEGTYRRL